MIRRVVVVGVAGVAALGCAVLVRTYRRDRARAEARLAAVDRHVVHTSFGAVEYADEGAGDPVLVSHGILHGCDGGLLSVRDTVEGRRVIAPSRFGYLGSTLPPGASSAAQADAFAELLDGLDLDAVDVVGISAGTGSALQLALRHPDRVRHLVVSSGNWPGSPTAAAMPAWARATFDPRLLGALRAVGGPALARAMGVPPGFPRDVEQRRRVDELVDTIFPVEPRAEGALFDAFVGDAEVEALPLEDLAVPTLVLHARDDPLASYDAAAAAAVRIPDATLVSLDDGGHLQIGQTARVRAETARFLGTPVPT